MSEERTVERRAHARALAVVARQPGRGTVKTRLAASIGEEAALAVYCRLLAETLAQAERVADTDLYIALQDGTADEATEPREPVRAAGFFAVAAAACPGRLGDHPAWRLIPQRGADLGERLGNVFADLFDLGYESVAIVNSDSPGLPSGYLERALSTAEREDPGRRRELILGPTADGGFYLVAAAAVAWQSSAKSIRAALLRARMGTASALADTVREAVVRGLAARQLPLWVDVDTAADLRMVDRLMCPDDDRPRVRGEPLEGLREIYLHVTNRCALSCPHCYNRTNPRGSGEMSTGEWRRAIDQAVALGASSFVFIGGDPFLRDDLLDLVAHVTGFHARKARIFFNGAISAETAAELARAGNGRLRPLVSVDGTEDVNDELRGAGNFAQTLQSIRNLVAAGLSPVVNTVALAPVLPGLPDMARAVKAAGAARLHLIFPHHRGGVPDHLELVPSGEAMLAAVRAVARMAGEIGLTLDNIPAWRRRLNGTQDFCSAGCKDLAIDPFGGVYACTITCGDPAFIAGDLRSSDLETIWRTSPAFVLLRSSHARDRAECAACPVVHACGGECWMQAHYAARVRGEPAGWTAPFPYCDLVRPMFEELIVDAIAKGEIGEACAPGEACVVGAAADGGQAAAGDADYTLFDCI